MLYYYFYSSKKNVSPLICALYRHKYSTKLWKNYGSTVFRLVLKYAQIVLAQHHKLLFWTKITFYKQVYLPLLLNQEPKPKFGCGCLPFSSISAHLSLRPLLLASLNIYKQVWICEKLWLSTDGRKFQWNDSGFVQTTRQSEQIKQG